MQSLRFSIIFLLNFFLAKTKPIQKYLTIFKFVILQCVGLNIIVILISDRRGGKSR